MKKKMGLLAATFLVFAITSLSALAMGDTPTIMGCTYQYTQCSNDYCTRPDGTAGAKGQHVYHCTTYPYVRTQSTCCGR